VTRLGIRTGEAATASLVSKRLDADVIAIDDPTDDISRLGEALTADEVDAILLPAGQLGLGLRFGVLAAVPKRRDSRDAVTGPTPLDGLEPASRINADSALRRAQLATQRPDLEATSGDASAPAIVALAELADPDEDAQPLDAASWPTAPGQGALVVITRAGRQSVSGKAEHRPSRLTTLSELGVLDHLAAAVGATVAAHAEFDDGLLFLSARFYRADGSGSLTSSHALYPEDVKDPTGDLAKRVAEELLAQGAAGAGGAA